MILLVVIHSNAMYCFMESFNQGICVPSKDLVAASSRPLILAVLRRGDSYGYALLGEVRKMSDGELNWSDGMLYPVLRRLERDGLVKSRWGRSDEGRRRRYYRLTSRGRAAAEEERQQWTTVDRALRRAWRLADQTP